MMLHSRLDDEVSWGGQLENAVYDLSQLPGVSINHDLSAFKGDTLHSYRLCCQ